MRSNTLFVLITDKLSELINKGEITDRYYNPGNLFSHVHIIMTNDDNPDYDLLKKTVGSAKLYIHNIYSGKRLFFLSLFWRKLLLKIWSKKFIKIANKYRPSLIRCHGASLNAFAAAEIKKKLNIPYIVSLHINYDEDQRKRATTFKEKIIYKLHENIERYGLKNSDLIMPVYKPIIPYLERINCTNYKVFYNVINPNNIIKKTSYKIDKKIRLISVGRQFKEKNPSNILKSLVYLKNAELTLIGNGPYHEKLVNLSRELGIEKKIHFIKSMENDKLCKKLHKFDIFIVHTEYWEISKSILEALLTGLPIILNRRIGLQVPELSKDIVYYVDNTEEGYKEGISFISSNFNFRKDIGNTARIFSERIWSPDITEEAFRKVYKVYLRNSYKDGN